jgi:PAS domain S-box-containing protein
MHFCTQSGGLNTMTDGKTGDGAPPIERALDHDRHGGEDPVDAEAVTASPEAVAALVGMPYRARTDARGGAPDQGSRIARGGQDARSSAQRAEGPQSDPQNASRVFPFAPSGPAPVDGGQSNPPPVLPRIAAAMRITAGPLDEESMLAALIGGLGYWLLACLSFGLAHAGGTVSAVWLPNAFLAALLLRVRLANELPLLLACFAGSLAANGVLQLPDTIAFTFSFANIVEVVTVLALTRAPGRREPDMSRLSDLGRFVWAGGLVGPLASAIVTAPVMGSGIEAISAGMVTWFLTDSMAMVLVVPAVLLLVDRARGTLPVAPAGRAEQVALLVGGTTCAVLVFEQNHYPLMFLIQPITLLHAFRLGSLGSAVHVAAVAIVAGAMTVMGHGPIAAASGTGVAHLQLLQAFIAANFLTGLPVAAILAGRDRMVARLAVGKREIDLLAANISDAILRFDLAGICTYASPSVREVLGTAPETFLGCHVTARLHPDAHDRATEALQRLVTGTSERERLTYRRFADGPDGAPVFLEADCTLVTNPATGAKEGVVVAARDVTERVELELLLTRARRHAENAARAKSEFLANMSHEIRTPMNGVLGFAELMLQGELEPDQRHFAELIVQSGRSMMMLLNDVLDLSKIESGQFAIHRAPLDLDVCLAECVALHRPTAERKGLNLDIAWDESTLAGQPWLLTDGLRLRQILLNLIGNAVKFTERGGVHVSTSVTSHEVRVTVADSGIGISPVQLETIFHPFTQGESQTARRYGGTGLGLSISRQLAGLLGGRIVVESVPGEGSRFTLVLPATLAPPLPDAADASLEEGSVRAGVLSAMPCPSRILLVEDHDINRILVTEMLERCGQQVEVAHDGNEGIAMVIDSIMRARPYDLVLMDVQMPDCDGLAATRAIRAEGIGPAQLPVIALTANAYPEDVTAAREAGMQGHLAKPIVFAQLARTLQRWLPTRIVEDGADLPPARAAMGQARAHSPQLIARWQARREEALAAVRAGLAEGWLEDHGGAPDARRGALAKTLHKLAGSAAMFDEPALGNAASALERALTAAPDPGVLVRLADAVLAYAQAPRAVSGGLPHQD